MRRASSRVTWFIAILRSLSKIYRWFGGSVCLASNLRINKKPPNKNIAVLSWGSRPATVKATGPASFSQQLYGACPQTRFIGREFPHALLAAVASRSAQTKLKQWNDTQGHKEQIRVRRRTLRSPDSSTAFRLSKELLATVDTICERDDLTRSQVYRRSITEYLKSQNVESITGATSADPNSVFFQRWQEGANEGGM